MSVIENVRKRKQEQLDSEMVELFNAEEGRRLAEAANRLREANRRSMQQPQGTMPNIGMRQNMGLAEHYGYDNNRINQPLR